MKDKKGFTLIEVISVLVILGLLASIVVMQYSTTIKESRKKLNEEQKSRLVEVAKDVSLNNKECLEISKENPNSGSKITLDQMYKNGYIANSVVKDLEENTILNSCIIIKWDTVYSKFDYNYSTDCATAKECNISAESEKVIVSSFYLGDGNTNYTSENITHYTLKYTTSISAEYCVTLDNESSCKWKKLDMNSNNASGTIELRGTENIAHLYIRNNNKNIISSIDSTIIYDREEPLCTWEHPTKFYINKDSSLELVLNCNDVAGIKNTELLSTSINYDSELVSISDATISTNGTIKKFKFIVSGTDKNGNLNISLKPNVISDNSGNLLASEKVSSTIYVDNIEPDGNVTIGDYDSRYTNKENVTLNFSNVSSDIDKICVSNYSEGNCNFVSYRSSYAWTLSSGDGQKNVYVYFADKAGNVKRKAVTIYLDRVEPNCLVTTVGFSQDAVYSLKNGSYIDYLINCTDNNQIGNNLIDNSMLLLSKPNVETSIISSDTNGTVVRVKALTGDGKTTIYLNEKVVQDAAGNGNVRTEVASINVDNTPPYNNRITLNFNSTITNLQDAVVSLDSDVKNESGYYCLKLVDNIQSCSSSDWIDFTPSTSIRLGSGVGTYTVYAYFKDKAGNVSLSAVSDEIKYDPSAVSCVLLENENFVTISSYSTNLASSPYSEDGIEWSNNPNIPKLSGKQYFFSYIKDQNGEINYCELLLN